MNKLNILSNDLDQIPKTKKWYQKELDVNKGFKQEIIDAFDRSEHNDLVMGENDFFLDKDNDKKILDRFLENQKDMPIEQIAKSLREHRVVSCEIQRKNKKEGKTWWNSTIGPAISRETINVWKVFTKNNEALDWNVITYLTFTRLNDTKWPDVNITAQQVEFPRKWAMLPEYIIFRKELTGEEFKKENIEL